MKTMLIVGITSVLVMSTSVASAQSSAASDTANAAPANELAEVIVTGTRRLDRTVAESSAPIDVLSGADLASYPAANMLDTLSNLVPSFIVGQNSMERYKLGYASVISTTRPLSRAHSTSMTCGTSEPAQSN